MLLTTPLLRVIRNGFPGWKISVLCGSWSLPILENNPNYDEIIPCNYPWLTRNMISSWKEFLSTVIELRRRKFDVVFNLRMAAKEAAVARLIGGGEVIGFDIEKSAWAHTRKIPYRADIHVADLYVEFIAAFGAERKHNGLELFISDTEYEKFNKKTRFPDKYTVIAPATPNRGKLWKPDRWAQISDWITEKLKIPVVFIGTHADMAINDEIINLMNNRPVDTTGELTLREAMLGIEKAEFVVSLDSAPVHIASAMKTPVIGLYSTTKPSHWGPYSNGLCNIGLSKTVEFKLGRGSYNKTGSLDLISVDDVKEAVLSVCEAEKII